MKKLLIFAFVLLVSSFVFAIPITVCDPGGIPQMNVAGANYSLSNSIYVSGQDCLTPSADNTTLDCNGYSISGDGAYAGLTVNQNGVIIKNCDIENELDGIFFGSADDAVLNTSFDYIGNGGGIVTQGTTNLLIDCQGKSFLNGYGIATSNPGGDNTTILNCNFDNTSISLNINTPDTTIINVNETNIADNIGLDMEYPGSSAYIDCNGGVISGLNATGSYGLYTNQFNTTVKNCKIENFDDGMRLDGSIVGMMNGTFTNNIIANITTAISCSGDSGNVCLRNNITSDLWSYNCAGDTFNVSGVGNIYSAANGTPSWNLFNFTTVSPPNWATAGSDLPVSAATVGSFWQSADYDGNPWTGNAGSTPPPSGGGGFPPPSILQNVTSIPQTQSSSDIVTSFFIMADNWARGSFYINNYMIGNWTIGIIIMAFLVLFSLFFFYYTKKSRYVIFAILSIIGIVYATYTYGGFIV